MISPNMNRAEAIRLINEIGMSDIWCAITFSIQNNEFNIHSEMSHENVRILIASYIFHDQELLNLIKEKI